MEELDHLARGRRRADVYGLHVVEAQAGADLRQDERVGLGVLRLVHARSPRTFRGPRSSAHSVARFFASSCSASMPASIAAFSFSQMRGTAKNQVGAHLREVRGDLTRIRAAGGREAEEHRHVVRRGPLGDVRHREPRDDPALVGELDHLLEAVDRAIRFACVSWTPFGGPVVPLV